MENWTELPLVTPDQIKASRKLKVMFTLQELVVLRSSLEHIQILGKDAKAIAALQTKLEELVAQKEQAQNETTAQSKK